MDFDALSFSAFLLVGATSLALLLSSDWRVSISALFLQYLGVFILTAVSWTWQLAGVKLIAGWIAAVILWIAMAGGSQQITNPRTNVIPAKRQTGISLSVILFRIFTSGVVILVVYSIQPTIAEWIPSMQSNQAIGSFLLIGLGLLHLGLTAEPMRVTLGLLTVLAGFEVVYSAVEISLLVEGLLAAVTLSLALIGVYMVTSPFSGGNE